MSADLVQHAFHGRAVRVITDEHNEPWFVATDVARILGYGDATHLTRRLDGDEKGLRSVETPGGTQLMSVITEPGLYAAILGSQVPSAREFKRWVTHELLPEVRRTGQYAPVSRLTKSDLAHMVIESEAAREQAEARALALAPRAEAWDVMVSASGDFAVDEAAKIVSRDPRVTIGRDRLFALMHDLGWVYRAGARGRWHARQSAVDTGRLVQRMSAAFQNARTGEIEVPAPTIRVTPKGVDALLKALTADEPLAVAR